MSSPVSIHMYMYMCTCIYGHVLHVNAVVDLGGGTGGTCPLPPFSGQEKIRLMHAAYELSGSASEAQHAC